MLYLKLNDEGGIAAYPYYFADLCRDNPLNTIPFPPSDADLAHFNCVRVTRTDSPNAGAAYNVVELPPANLEGVWTQQWSLEPLPDEVVAENLEAAKVEALRKIDADVDALYGAVIGNRASEYTQAEAEASAYRAAGYAGDVPPMVQPWATVKGWTGQAAADDILATAAQWREAQGQIREKRLGAKELFRTALTALQVDAHLDTWTAFIAYMRRALGVA